MSLQNTEVSTGTAAASASAPGARTAAITFFCTEGLNTPLELDIYFLVGNGNGVSVGTFKEAGSPGKRLPWDGAGDNISGQLIQGEVSVPEAALPDIIGLEMKGRSTADREYVNRIELSFGGTDRWLLPTNTWVHTRQGVRYLFGTAEAYLPGQEPEHLRSIRQDDLNIIRGSNELQSAELPGPERQAGDRVYDYEVYHDLGDATKTPPILRPVLGNAGNAWPNYRFPYPRRVRTGRTLRERPEPLLGDTEGVLHAWKALPQLYEDRTMTGGTFWVPLDEGFNSIKQQDFDSYTLMGQISLVSAMADAALEDLKGRRPVNPSIDSFADMDHLYDQIYQKDFSLSPASLFKALRDRQQRSGRHTDANPMGRGQHKLDLDLTAGGLLLYLPVHLIFRLAPLLARLPFAGARKLGTTALKVKKLAGDFKSLFTFPRPVSWDGRRRAWMMDEEFGRQALAGVNPCAITAVTESSQLGAIWGYKQQLEALTEGHSLQQLMAAAGQGPRLLVIDHTAVFQDYAPEICKLKNSKGEKIRHGYSGRALLYRRDDQSWVPVAIELKDGALADGTADQVTVYTPTPAKGGAPAPTSDTAPEGDQGAAAAAVSGAGVQHLEAKPYMWLLVKGVFTTLDSAHHQLITHWLRTHAATEPYIIATRRQLSSLHPVNKLLMPHFAYTMQINANARATLICSGGIIEEIFTPKEFSMRMSAEVYGALWEFDTQSLPKDLAARGLATLTGEKGRKVGKLLLEDYPYAEDGLLLWDAIEKWVGSYLQLYYKEAGADVIGDTELMAWWTEIKTKGHPDKQTGWPDLKTLDDLVYILTTMIWTASCHHAAINFSQYGYAGFALDRPFCTYTQLPREGDARYKAVQGKDAPSELYLQEGNPADAAEACRTLAAEGVYLEMFAASLFDTLRGILTVELLSTHAETETYINDSNHPTFLDGEAHNRHAAFLKDLAEVKKTILQRNKDPSRRMRRDPSKEDAQFPYTFLIPDSLKKVTERGNNKWVHSYGVSNMGVPQSISI